MRGLDMMKTRIGFLGEGADERLVEGKLRSMHAALENSYQAEWVIFNKGTSHERKFKALINPDKLKED